MFLLFYFTDSCPQCSTSGWGYCLLHSRKYWLSLDCDDFGSACQCDNHIRIFLFTGNAQNLKFIFCISCINFFSSVGYLRVNLSFKEIKARKRRLDWSAGLQVKRPKLFFKDMQCAVIDLRFCLSVKLFPLSRDAWILRSRFMMHLEFISLLACLVYLELLPRLFSQ